MKRYIIALLPLLCTFAVLTYVVQRQFDTTEQYAVEYSSINYGLFFNDEYNWVFQKTNDQNQYNETIGKRSIVRFKCDVGSENDTIRILKKRFKNPYIQRSLARLVVSVYDMEDSLTISNTKKAISYHVNDTISEIPGYTQTRQIDNQLIEDSWVFNDKWAYHLRKFSLPDNYQDKDLKELDLALLQGYFNRKVEFWPYNHSQFLTDSEYDIIFNCLIGALCIMCLFSMVILLANKTRKNKQASFLMLWITLGMIAWIIAFSYSGCYYLDVTSRVVTETDIFNISTSHFQYTEILSYIVWLGIALLVGELLLFYVSFKVSQDYSDDYLLPTIVKKIFLCNTDKPILIRGFILLVMWPIFYLLPIPLVGLYALCFVSLLLTSCIAIRLIYSSIMWVIHGSNKLS